MMYEWGLYDLVLVAFALLWVAAWFYEGRARKGDDE